MTSITTTIKGHHVDLDITDGVADASIGRDFRGRSYWSTAVFLEDNGKLESEGGEHEEDLYVPKAIQDLIFAWLEENGY